MSIYMEDFVKGNWRAVALASLVPCLIMLFGNIFLIKDSPRHLIVKNQTAEGIEIMNHMGKVNNKNFRPFT